MSKNIKKLIILTTGRTGSTYLFRALNLHSEFFLKGEIFNPDSRTEIVRTANGKSWQPGSDTWKFLEDNLYSPSLSGGHVRGFKLIGHHARAENSPESEVWRRIAQDDSIYVVYLFRKNQLARIASEARAKKSNLWHPGTAQRTADYQEPVSIGIDPLQTIARIRKSLEIEANLRKLTAGRRFLSVYYEDLQIDAAAALDRIVEFVGEDKEPVDWPEFRPGSSSARSTIITNLDEVVSCFKAEGMEWMLQPYIP